MCDKSYRSANHLILIFTIHHTKNLGIIDDILIRTMCTLDSIPPAILDCEETKRFSNILHSLQRNILSEKNVSKEREKERSCRDIRDKSGNNSNTEKVEENEFVNSIYKILKNNDIMGQVLKNKYGSLEKEKIKEIISVIADSGLRLVNVFLKDEGEISNMAKYIKKKYPNYSMTQIRNMLSFESFLWTIINITRLVRSINIPALKEVLDEIVCEKNNPSYDLIGYFSQLDRIEELEKKEKEDLRKLLKIHGNNDFVKKVLSLRTQYYMNTHRTKEPIQQAICSLLGIKYVPKFVSSD